MVTSQAQLAAVKRWRQRNPDRVREMMTAWRNKNRAALTKYNRDYARKRRAKAKLAAKRKNGGKKRGL